MKQVLTLILCFSIGWLGWWLAEGVWQLDAVQRPAVGNSAPTVSPTESIEHQYRLWELTKNSELPPRIRALFLHSHLPLYPDLPLLGGEERKCPDYRVPDELKGVTIVEWGTQLVRHNRPLLSELERQHRVPPAMLASMLAKESTMGANTGCYRAAGVFASVVLWGNPEQKQWARRELVALVEVAERINLHPLEIQSSYAGAFGLPQFLPTSYLAYAVDGDGDGEIDMWNYDDALASAANFLAEHNYRVYPAGAVFSYNRSSSYVRARFRDAEAIARRS